MLGSGNCGFENSRQRALNTTPGGLPVLGGVTDRLLCNSVANLSSRPRGTYAEWVTTSRYTTHLQFAFLSIEINPPLSIKGKAKINYTSAPETCLLDQLSCQRQILKLFIS